MNLQALHFLLAEISVYKVHLNTSCANPVLIFIYTE